MSFEGENKKDRCSFVTPILLGSLSNGIDIAERIKSSFKGGGHCIVLPFTVIGQLAFSFFFNLIQFGKS